MLTVRVIALATSIRDIFISTPEKSTTSHELRSKVDFKIETNNNKNEVIIYNSHQLAS